MWNGEFGYLDTRLEYSSSTLWLPILMIECWKDRRVEREAGILAFLRGLMRWTEIFEILLPPESPFLRGPSRTPSFFGTQAHQMPAFTVCCEVSKVRWLKARQLTAPTKYTNTGTATQWPRTETATAKIRCGLKGTPLERRKKIHPTLLTSTPSRNLYSSLSGVPPCPCQF